MERNNCIETLFAGRVYNNKNIRINEETANLEIFLNIENIEDFLSENGFSKKILEKSGLRLVSSKNKTSFLLAEENVEGILPLKIKNEKIDYLRIFNFIKVVENPLKIVSFFDLEKKYDFSEEDIDYLFSLRNIGLISFFENKINGQKYFIFSDLLIDFANVFFKGVGIETID